MEHSIDLKPDSDVDASRHIWAARLDKTCAISAALIPVGLVIGNLGFEAMIGIAGIGWLLRCLLTGEWPRRPLVQHPLVIPWLCWYGAMVLSVLINGPGSKGWAHDMVFIRYLLFGVAMLDVSRRLPVSRYFLLGLGAGVLWAAVNTLSAYGIGYDLLGKPLIRYTGKLKEASRISGMTAYVVPFFLAWSILGTHVSRKTRYAILGLGSIALIQLLQTHVRTAIIAAVAGIFFSIVVYVRRRISTAAAVSLIVGLTLIVGVFFHYGRMWRFESFYDRIYYWKVAWVMWQENPLTGVGISSFQDAYKAMAESGKVSGYEAPDRIVYELAEQTHAHNLLFMIMSCTGLLGLGAFAWLFITALRLIFHAAEGYRIGLVSWPVVLLTIGLTGFNIYHSWYQALLAFFLVLIGCRLQEANHA